MKKLIVLLLLCLLLPVAAMAEASDETLIEAPDLNVWLVPPENGILMARDSSASVFNRAGYFQPDVLAYMEETDAYAIIVPADSDDWQCTLSLWPEDAADMAGVSDFMAEVLCKEYRTSYEEAGYIVDEVVYYLSAGYEYLRLDCHCPNEDGTETFVLFYGTIQNGHALWLDMLSWDGPLTEDEKQVLADVVDTVWCEALE